MKPKAYSYLRMSTDIQLKGDSRRRQLESSKTYAEANGLELADDAQLEDIGISAFKGANVKEGALGQFLAAVKSGAVERGSYLLVESLDRLSREEILPAHSLFLGIVQSGINLVTLADGRVYQAKTTNLVDMITSLVIMERAHEESKTKSMRVGAAWKNKRAKASQGEPMTARCPAWLRLSDDRKSYELISDRVAIVREIFADTAAGVGMYSVARRLNERGLPAFGGANGWHRSYVAKVLQNRAVLGEFQPHLKVDGRRVPDGPTIPNYFPAIIGEELFYETQHSKASRKGKAGSGRKGPSFANLFSRIATCAYCRSMIVFENKGSGTKGGTYLVCDGAKRRRGCQAGRWRYKDFEASFLAFVRELDLDSIVNADAEAAKRKTVDSEISSLHGELASVGAMMESTYALLEKSTAVDFVSQKLNELEQRRSTLLQSLERKTIERDALANRISAFAHSKDELHAFIANLQAAPTQELFKLRAQIASRLKVLVETIIVAPLGDKPNVEKTIAFLREQPDSTDVVQALEAKAGTAPYFAVGFRNGTVRAVYPQKDDPLRYEQVVVADGSKISVVEFQ